VDSEDQRAVSRANKWSAASNSIKTAPRAVYAIKQTIAALISISVAGSDVPPAEFMQ